MSTGGKTIFCCSSRTPATKTKFPVSTRVGAGNFRMWSTMERAIPIQPAEDLGVARASHVYTWDESWAARASSRVSKVSNKMTSRVVSMRFLIR